ncbi:MAG: glucuronate isomerase [Thermoflexibacter sp.]|jgi:glucuronate isomerase|nr:glucuronate isomerase [Thermoflexibacter sp.]
MKKFLSNDFLLQSKTAKTLYHDFAKEMPIIDYHCHLSPKDIAENRQFENITKIWLEGDHYKWRAMRTNGISEYYCTGMASDYEKFMKWAETVPHTMRNPLYHWTHLELKKFFGIEKILNPVTANEIFEECNALLASPEFTTRGIIKRMNVEVICTTDDPTDSLEYHQLIAEERLDTKVLPTFRPDKVLNIENLDFFNAYLDKLQETTGIEIRKFKHLQDALSDRIQFFHAVGGRLADHGLETMYAEEFKESEIKEIFRTAREGKEIKGKDALKFKSAVLAFLGERYAEKGWVQQFHLGAMRNNNSRMLGMLGADAGFDSIGDFSYARPLSKFLDYLDQNDRLAKTIIYNLNPKDNEMIATMLGNFNDGAVRGKIQFGSGWWFLDQKDGMERQMNALSNMGLLSCFVGMLTDSRSFLSYSRHEYFRRVLCNLLGNDVENGELPNDISTLGQMVQNICYHNAKEYFSF